MHKIKIDLKRIDDLQVSIYNLDGKLIKEKELNNLDLGINIIDINLKDNLMDVD